MSIEIPNRKMRYVQAVQRWRGDDVAAKYYATPWNVEGLLQQDAIGSIYGPPASYKSVMAMDIGCSTATGRDWCGRKTRRGPVLYISAEGGAGIYAMRDAWEKKNGVKADQLAIYVGSPNIAEITPSGTYREGFGSGYTVTHDIVKHLKEFRELLDQPAVLIVIDTYAQTSPDDTKAAVTAYEKSIRRLIKALAPGASVLVVDHSTKEGSTWMGSNAKLGNLDMMGMVKKAGDDIVLSMRNGKGKIKNAAPFDDIRMTPRLVELDHITANGKTAVAPILEYVVATFTDREALALKLVGEGMTYGDLKTAWNDHPKFAEAATSTRKTALSRAIRGLRDKDALNVEGLEYDQTEEGPKERPISDNCLLLPM